MKDKKLHSLIQIRHSNDEKHSVHNYVTFSTNVPAKEIFDTIKGVTVIRLPDYYKQVGAIFTEDYDLKIDLGNIKRGYTPSIDEIKTAEEIFFRDHATVINQSIDTKKYFCNFIRQYVGYIDCVGDKKLMIQIINNAKPKM